MNKLTIEHLAPYLPYGVKLNLNRNKGMFVSNNVNILDTDISLNNTVNEFYLQYQNITYGMHDIKPILRPLSDLTKEIEHNGERFVPFDRLPLYARELIKSQYLREHLGTLCYKDFKWLLSLHFNVFDLDPSLWINKNTIS